MRCSEPSMFYLLNLVFHFSLGEKLKNFKNTGQMDASHDPFSFRFPPEIGSLVFSLSMAENHDKPWSLRTTLDKLPMPFLLGSVSRKWRQLAHSTPQLWSTISFTLLKTRGNNLPAPPPLQSINDWLEKSRSLPLTLCVVEDPESDFCWETCRPVVDALNQHSDRWHKVSLDIDKRYLRHFRGTSTPTDLYTLEVGQNIEYLDDGEEDEDASTAYFSMSSRPSPTRLAIQAMRLSEIDVALRNVIYLTLKSVPPRECIAAIKLAPLLESFTLSALALPEEDDSSSQQVFKHLRLRKLFFRGTTDAEALDVFNEAMEFPSLEELSYEANYQFAADSLISLIDRSGKGLKTLTVGIFRDSKEITDGLLELLDAVPCLEGLVCDFPGGPIAMDHLLQQLSWPSSEDSEFLPDLLSLTIRLHSPISSWGYIPSIFSWPNRKALSLKVDAVGDVAMEYDDLYEISQLIAEGFDLHILGVQPPSFEPQQPPAPPDGDTVGLLSVPTGDSEGDEVN